MQGITWMLAVKGLSKYEENREVVKRIIVIDTL